LSNVEVWPWSTDGSKLIAKFAVQGLEPSRKVNDCFTVGIENDHPIVDVLHIRRLDAGVEKVLIGGIKRMINFEGKRTFRESTGNINISNELPELPPRPNNPTLLLIPATPETVLPKAKPSTPSGALVPPTKPNPPL